MVKQMIEVVNLRMMIDYEPILVLNDMPFTAPYV